MSVTSKHFVRAALSALFPISLWLAIHHGTPPIVTPDLLPPAVVHGGSAARRRQGTVAAIYVRHSTEFQHSVEDQIRACREWAAAHGYQVPDELIFIDRGVSGKRFRREGFTRLKTALTAGKIDCLIVL